MRRISLLLLVLACTASSQTSPALSQRQVLADKMKRFADYQQTFVQFGKIVQSSNDDYEVVNDLNSDASQMSDYVSGASALLEIYDNLSCEEDRARVRPIIERELAGYIKLIDPLIKAVNAGIAFTKMPGVVSEATHLREDIRETKSLMESIKLNK